jgi:hypothetical protein
MPNEKVSQMTSLTAAEIAPSDLFLVGDVSAYESKKMTADQLLVYVVASGSFIDPTLVDSASYATYALSTTSASFSSRTISGSHALRANNADTASYFSSSIVVAVSSSFADKSHLADSASYAGVAQNAVNASNLLYLGTPNGTASFAISGSSTHSSSFAITSSFAHSASFARSASFTVSSSFSDASLSTISASYASNFNNPVKAWAMVTWSFGALYSQPQLYLQNNITSVEFVNSSNGTWNYSGDYTWINYGIIFNQPLPSTNYTLIGQAFSAYLKPEVADVVFHPVYSNRSVTTCTMSIAINLGVSSVANWFAGSSGSFPTTDQSYVTFTVLG